MDIKTTDLVSLFEKSLAHVPEGNLEEIGFVVQWEIPSARSTDLQRLYMGSLLSSREAIRELS